MRFLIDAQLPPMLARWLNERGYPAEHVVERQLGSASDRVVWNAAHQLGATLITKDSDFSHLRMLSDVGPAIVWIRRPNCRSIELIRWFDLVFPGIVQALERGEVLVEVR